MVKQSLIKHVIIDTALGQILIVGSEKGLRKISIHKSRNSASASIAQQFPQSIESPDEFGDLPQRLERYARGERIIFNDTIDFDNTTPFQRAVWEATRAIPHSETRSYEWIAQRIGRPKAARAVGQALKSNPFPIVVPCHRVIGKDSSLTGFSCGIDIKKHLLDLEASPHAKNRAH
ncbi:MAG: methylated-DNA--[protein]-cysteine S-methyltransferase [Dehalococcoidia bacterium]|jgi:methylated-DNA-[protein]-cysteine S-methyltransferase